MKRKLLVLTGLLGICVFGVMDRPALATPFCSFTYCSGRPDDLCQCPQGTQAYPTAFVTECIYWYADCNYL